MKEGIDAVDIKSLNAKLDRVLDKMDLVIRLEERQDNMSRRQDRQDSRMDGHSKRISELETELASNSKTTGMVERAFWLAASAIVGMVVYFTRS